MNIIIEGNSEDRTAVTLHHVRCYNSRVYLHNLTVDLKDADGIILDNSEMYADNILVTSSDSEQSSHTGIMLDYGSNLAIINSKIEYCNYGFRVLKGSYLNYDNVTISDYTQRPIGVTNSRVCVKNIKDSGEGNTVTLKDDYKNYDWIDIQFRTNDSNRSCVRIYNPGDNYTIPVVVPYTNTSGTSYDKRARFKLVTDSSGSKITIDNLYQFTITSGSTQTISVSTLSEGAFVINGVYAGFNG